jgi:hypothetical protein
MRVRVAAGLIAVAMTVTGCGALGPSGDRDVPAAAGTTAASGPGTNLKGATGRPIGAAKPGEAKASAIVRPGKLTPAEGWPNACHLLTNDEITAILPDAEKIDSRPYGVTTLTVDDPLPTNSTFDKTYARNGACRWGITLRGDNATTTTISVRLRGVGDAAILKKYAEYWQHFNTLIEAPPGVQSCYIETLAHDTWVCQQGIALFEVAGEAGVEYAEVGSGDGWERKVLPMVATTVAAKFRK